MSTEGAPSRISLLPALRLQEGYLCDVWQKAAQHQVVQTVLRLTNSYFFLSLNRLNKLKISVLYYVILSSFIYNLPETKFIMYQYKAQRPT